MAVSNYDIGPFLSAQRYWDAINYLNKEFPKTEHADYMNFAELYGDYVASYEKGHPDAFLNGLRMQRSM